MDYDQSLASIKLVRLYRQLTEQLDQQLSGLGLKRGQHAILLAIADLQAPKAADIACRLQVDKAAVSRSVAACKKHGWVAAHAIDGKARSLQLTPAGQELVTEIRNALILVEQRFQQSVSANLYQALLDERLL
ncbi:MarR family winged helix-turn-helix transcriptional regulator [Salinibius halmophilus]|uniref:MarR family winged helix-turn-helix transcriptional regulator n=1 Tax=Salinibius halmophilus TaxID=1853216 RepID=UPI000E671C9B|nr:MarR family transcriptional regulator [Salinibius halmophilus]